ncbi:diguanylate cyclase [Cupriavidus sp. CuC1]
MLRFALPTMSVDRRFGIVASTLGLLFVALTSGLLVHQWGTYARADHALSHFQVFRATLLAMEKVSAERGPTNSALGEDVPIPAQRAAALRAARAESDARIAHLLGLLESSHCDECSMEWAAAQRAHAELAAARANIDQVIRVPLAQRTDQVLEQAVVRMVEVIPQFAPITNASTKGVLDGDANALNCLMAARLAAVLREQAGLLGSRFTAALASRRNLTEAEQFAIERTRGGIDQLGALLRTRVMEDTALAHGAFVRMKRQYFGDGLAYVNRVRALASLPGGAVASTGEFAAQYVPLMRSIVEFRDEALTLAEEEVRSHRHAMLARLVGAAGILSALMCALGLGVWLFRRQVIQPFAEAARVIRAIAAGGPSADLPSNAYRGEIQELFDAVQVLKTNDLERTRLEQERQRLIAELRMMAETDSLTRLLNRRAFESRAQAACLYQDARAPYLALVMIDIDHFKRINDTYGHAAGDRALEHMADLCRDTWRKDDIVARIGGEEFAVLAGVRERAQALELVQRLRIRLAQASVPIERAEGFTMSASFGIAYAARADSTSIRSLLKRADRLLYQAKLAGRDRIEVEADDCSQP